MQIEKRKLNELSFYPGNPRRMPDDVFKKLKKSISEFGYVEPLVINSKNQVIGGNQRLKALKELLPEDSEVEVVIVDLPLNREKALNIALNKIQGEFDMNLLKDFISDLEPLDVELTGLDVELEELETDKEIEEDNYEEPEFLAPKSQRGDIYQLGNHRLMCGDATSKEDVEKLMNGEKADMVFTDPPYNIGLDYSKKITSKVKYTDEVSFSDSKTDKEYETFLDLSLKNIVFASKNDCHIFVWCDESYIYLLQELYIRNGINLKRINLWIKNNFTPTPQVAFNKVYEPCLYGTIGKPYLNAKLMNLTEIVNKELQKSDDVYDYIIQGINLWLEDREKVYIHTTQKPITLCEKPIKKCSTKLNDIILDLFGGSGSTLLACEQLNRRCFMMEIEPHYVDVIIDRWEKFTGKQAIKL